MNGKKTYLIGLLIGIIATAQYLHWIDEDLATLLLTLAGGGGAMTLRHGIAKSKE